MNDSRLGPTAYGKPVISGGFKQKPEDFIVSERLAFEPDGEGDYLWLRIRKRGENTSWVASELSGVFDIDRAKVSYAGLKDRNALTDQWFAVETSGNLLNKAWLDDRPSLELLDSTRHRNGLTQRDVAKNHFTIRISNVEYSNSDWESRLRLTREQGVPNYFGPQRFGHGGENLEQAQSMFEGERVPDRFLRGIYLSAVRAFLFNSYLAERVRSGSWCDPIEGEALIADLGGGRLILPWNSAAARDHIDRWKAHPSGPLYGRGDAGTKKRAALLETEVLDRHPDLLKGLERNRLRAARRPLRMRPSDLEWQINGNDLMLSFSLRSGEYATSLLREIATLEEAERHIR